MDKFSVVLKSYFDSPYRPEYLLQNVRESLKEYNFQLIKESKNKIKESNYLKYFLPIFKKKETNFINDVKIAKSFENFQNIVYESCKLDFKSINFNEILAYLFMLDEFKYRIISTIYVALEKPIKYDINEIFNIFLYKTSQCKINKTEFDKKFLFRRIKIENYKNTSRNTLETINELNNDDLRFNYSKYIDYYGPEETKNNYTLNKINNFNNEMNVILFTPDFLIKNNILKEYNQENFQVYNEHNNCPELFLYLLDNAIKELNTDKKNNDIDFSVVNNIGKIYFKDNTAGIYFDAKNSSAFYEYNQLKKNLILENTTSNLKVVAYSTSSKSDYKKIKEEKEEDSFNDEQKFYLEYNAHVNEEQISTVIINSITQKMKVEKIERLPRIIYYFNFYILKSFHENERIVFIPKEKAYGFEEADGVFYLNSEKEVELYNNNNIPFLKKIRFELYPNDNSVTQVQDSIIKIDSKSLIYLEVKNSFPLKYKKDGDKKILKGLEETKSLLHNIIRKSKKFYEIAKNEKKKINQIHILFLYDSLLQKAQDMNDFIMIFNNIFIEKTIKVGLATIFEVIYFVNPSSINMRDISQKVDELKSGRQNEINKIKEEKEEEINKMKKEKEEKEEEINKMKKEKEEKEEEINKMKKEKEEKEEEINKIKKEKEEKEDDIKKIKNEKEEEIKKIKNEKEDDIKKIKKETEDDIKRIKNEKEEEIKKIKNEKEDDIKRIKNEKEEEIKKIKNEKEDDIKKIKNEKEDDIKKIKKETEDDIKKIKKETEDDIKRIKNEKEEEIKKIKNEKEDDIKKIKKETEDDIKRIKNEKEEEIKKIKNEKEDDIKKIKNEKEEEIKKIKNEKEEEIKKIKKEKEEEINKIINENNKLIQELKGENRRLIEENNKKIEKIYELILQKEFLNKSKEEKEKAQKKTNQIDVKINKDINEQNKDSLSNSSNKANNNPFEKINDDIKDKRTVIYNIIALKDGTICLSDLSKLYIIKNNAIKIFNGYRHVILPLENGNLLTSKANKILIYSKDDFSEVQKININKYAKHIIELKNNNILFLSEDYFLIQIQNETDFNKIEGVGNNNISSIIETNNNEIAVILEDANLVFYDLGKKSSLKNIKLETSSNLNNKVVSLFVNINNLYVSFYDSLYKIDFKKKEILKKFFLKYAKMYHLENDFFGINGCKAFRIKETNKNMEEKLLIEETSNILCLFKTKEKIIISTENGIKFLNST